MTPKTPRQKAKQVDESPRSEDRPGYARTPSLRGFLPVNDEPRFSTRGQNLPSLISHLSSSFRNDSNFGRRSSVTNSHHSHDDASADLEAGRTSGEYERGRSTSRQRHHSRHNSLYVPLDAQEQGRPEPHDGHLSDAALALLMTPQMRSMRLIGNSNPRYRWEQYWTTDEALAKMKKPLREYYQRNNELIQQYVYIDRLLDSSLPHSLIQEYSVTSPSTGSNALNVPKTITEEPVSPLASSPLPNIDSVASPPNGSAEVQGAKVKRTRKNLYKIPDEQTPLMPKDDEDASDDDTVSKSAMPEWTPEEETDSSDRIVTIAIYINLLANTILLILKIIVTVMTSSVSVLAALVDAVLDFLSTGIVWTTTRLISRQDQYMYPAGRSKLEPIGVLVFSVIMVTSFFQVALEGFNRLTGADHIAVQLGIPATAIMATTVAVKGACWLWCRLIKNSSVQALAQDASTDVYFNLFSIIFPLIGYYANIWWLDPLGGILLSLFVIEEWSRTSVTHIRNLSGAAAKADERNVLLYLTMRFAKTIQQIQGLQAYHAGDKLNVEVDIVLDEKTTLRDAHDLGESLQYVLESVPTVERAFVHLDYAAQNLPTHMRNS